jgi:16S rRNA (uracil1498-N3)-methyltransferase
MDSAKPLTRLYFPGEIAAHGECRLPPDAAHHVQHVLRLAAGAPLTLFDGEGAEYDAAILRIGKSGATVRVSTRREVDRESPLSVVLAQAISSSERMDFTIQKTVELGVAAIQPVTASRSVVRLDAERSIKRVAHWQAVAVAACEQCGRNRVPVVRGVMSLGSWLGELTPHTAPVRLVLSPHAAGRLADIPRPYGPIMLLAGPEGGLAPEEEQAARHAGFAPVRLGPRVLRTETAAVAALAALQTLWGDF